VEETIQDGEPPGAALDSSVARRKSWLKAQLDGKQAIHGIYVELVVLAVIIALEGKRTSDSDVLLSLFGAIVAIALAELYAYYVGTMIASGRKPSRREFLAAVGDTAGSLLAIAPPVLLVVLGVAGVLRLETGFTAATWVGVGVIGGYALIAHRRTGLSTRRSIPPAVFVALIGLGLVLLKQYFH
jgi:hypothetical protein